MSQSNVAVSPSLTVAERGNVLKDGLLASSVGTVMLDISHKYLTSKVSIIQQTNVDKRCKYFNTILTITTSSFEYRSIHKMH